MGLSEHNKQARNRYTVGSVWVSKRGDKAEILKRLGGRKVLIRFLYTGRISTATTPNILRGEFSDMSVHSCGAINDLFPNHLQDKSYLVWRSMLDRCYSPPMLKMRPRYGGVTVCEKWHKYSMFKKWFDKNYLEGYHLDKDLKTKGNKVYSPHTCLFVPQFINSLTVNSAGGRGGLPVGVSACDSKTNPYKTELRYVEEGCRKRRYLGCYKTAEAAFLVYKEAKEKEIHKVAEAFYKRREISEEVYICLLNYKIDIDD